VKGNKGLNEKDLMRKKKGLRLQKGNIEDCLKMEVERWIKEVRRHSGSSLACDAAIPGSVRIFHSPRQTLSILK
jgi:hypothetical protein